MKSEKRTRGKLLQGVRKRRGKRQRAASVIEDKNKEDYEVWQH